MLTETEFRIVSGKDIDAGKWEKLILHSPFNQQLFSAIWFLNIVQPQWLAIVIGDYDAGLVLPLKKKLGIEYLVQPQFCQYFSWLGNREKLSEKTKEQIAYCLEKNYIKVDINLDFILPISLRKVQLTQRVNCILEKDSGFNEINYSKQIKRHIKQANAHQLSIKEVDDAEEILSLFIENNNKEHAYFKNNQIQLLREILRVGKQQGHFVFQEVRNSQGELLSGAAWFFYSGNALFFFSARKNNTLEKGFFSLMIDWFIKNRVGANKFLDFEGSDKQGLMRYYLGFSATKREYYSYRKRITVSLLGR